MAQGGSSQHGSKKGWTPAEDQILAGHVQEHGEGNWSLVPINSGLTRSAKSCRSRWVNFLRPNLKKEPFSVDEERLIAELHGRLGNKWALIAAQLRGRTDSEIKNYWNTRMKRHARAGLALSCPEVRQEHQPSNSSPSLLAWFQPPHPSTSSFSSTVGSLSLNDPSPSIPDNSFFNNQLTLFRDKKGGLALSLVAPDRSFSSSCPATAPFFSQSLSNALPISLALDNFPSLGVTKVVAPGPTSTQPLEATATTQVPFQGDFVLAAPNTGAEDHMVMESEFMSVALPEVDDLNENLGSLVPINEFSSYIVLQEHKESGSEIKFVEELSSLLNNFPSDAPLDVDMTEWEDLDPC